MNNCRICVQGNRRFTRQSRQLRGCDWTCSSDQHENPRTVICRNGMSAWDPLHPLVPVSSARFSPPFGAVDPILRGYSGLPLLINLPPRNLSGGFKSTLTPFPELDVGGYMTIGGCSAGLKSATWFVRPLSSNRVITQMALANAAQGFTHN